MVRTAILFDVIIEKAFRKKGLGRKLMEYLEEFLETSNFNRIVLSTTDAEYFYRKLGFRTSERALKNSDAVKQLRK